MRVFFRALVSLRVNQKLTGACTSCPKLKGAAAPIAPTLLWRGTSFDLKEKFFVLQPPPTLVFHFSQSYMSPEVKCAILT